MVLVDFCLLHVTLVEVFVLFCLKRKAPYKRRFVCLLVSAVYFEDVLVQVRERRRNSIMTREYFFVLLQGYSCERQCRSRPWFRRLSRQWQWSRLCRARAGHCHTDRFATRRSWNLPDVAVGHAVDVAQASSSRHVNRGLHELAVLDDPQLGRAGRGNVETGSPECGQHLWVFAAV